jgi:gamma-glutamylcyclotransferase (GGCT)/AIG2-like uncharacterized protein YtfP
VTECLFVYGTLLPGRAPAEIADVVNALVPVGPATVRGRLYDLGEYPGVILNGPADDEADTIPGQVFALPPDPPALARALQRLDAYEAYYPDDPAHSLFVRRRTAIHRLDGLTQSCWIYVYNQALPG